MVDKLNENINRKDLELVLEVNRKAIEIEVEVSEQNEQILSNLLLINKKQDEYDGKLDELLDRAETHSRDIFKMQVLFITGLISLVVQVIQLFLRK